MKLFLLLGLACVANCVSLFELEEWMQYKIEHNKSYDHPQDKMRLKIWLNTKRTIEAHNEKFEAGEVSYEMGINKFSDLTQEELDMYTGYKKIEKDDEFKRFVTFEPKGVMAEEVNWAQKGYVTPVKDQEKCGSCYSFSVTGVVEGQHFKKTGKLVSFSEQQIVDCAYHMRGCHGGNMEHVYQYIHQQGGLDTESSYPYKGTDRQNCEYKPASSGTTLSGYDPIQQNEEELKKAVSTVGPVSVAIDVENPFFHYKGGVFDFPQCGNQLNHAVLIVGYGSEGGKDYWLVKNSWGTTWGQAGYVKMARNKNNQCGIASDATVPTGVSESVTVVNEPPKKTSSITKFFMSLVMSSE